MADLKVKSGVDMAGLAPEIWSKVWEIAKAFGDPEAAPSPELLKLYEYGRPVI